MAGGACFLPPSPAGGLTRSVSRDASSSWTAPAGRARATPSFRRYDAPITGWSLALPRSEPLRRRPAVLFVCEDEEQAIAFLRAADDEVTGHVSVLRTPEEEWEHPGRARMLFACERDAHEGTVRCWRLPALPPGLRARPGLVREPEPEQVELLDAIGPGPQTDELLPSDGG